MHEDFVYLGLENGLVASYSIEAKRPGMKEEQRRWNSVTHKKIGGLGTKVNSPIKQMQIIDPQSTFAINAAQSGQHAVSDMSLLFVLSEDGRLRALQQHTLEIVIDFNTIKDIDMFTIDLKSPHHVAVHTKLKRKLSLYNYTAINIMDATKNKHELIRELALNDLPLSLSWYNDLIIVALRNKYILLNPVNGEIRETPVEVEGVQPCQSILGTNEILLASKYELGIFVDFKGSPLPRNPIAFGAPPFRIEHCDHFIIGLFNSELSASATPATSATASSVTPANISAQFISVRIASLLDGRIVQTAPIPSPISSCANSDKLVLLTNSGDLFVLILVSIEEQIAQYLDLSLTDEALKLFQRTNPNQEKLQEFHIQSGFVMLKDLLLMPAFIHFSQSNIDPRELISFFPDLIPKDIPYERKYKSLGTFEEFIEKGRKKAESRTEDKRYKAIISLSAKQISRQCRLFLAQYLWERREKFDSSEEPTLISTIDTALLILAMELNDDPNIQQPQTSTTNSSSSSTSSNTVTTSNNTNTSNKSLINQFSTTNFPFLLSQLLFPTNHIIVSEAELYLLTKHQYLSLALFYQSIHEQRKALEIWQRLGLGEFQEKGKVSEKSQQEGIQKTIKTLQSLGDSPVFWEFAEWVLLKDSEEGLKIFTQHNQGKPISHEKVLAYLRKVNAKKTGNNDSGNNNQRDSVEIYLEHIVLNGENNDPIYHTQLATTYISQVFELQKQQQNNNNTTNNTETPVKPSYLNRPKPGSESGQLGQLRAKLYHFLQTSNYYDTESVLHQLLLLVWPKENYPRTDTILNSSNDLLWLPSPPIISSSNIGMIEEMISLFAKLNLHFKVLHLFVFGLGDQNGAAQYCLHVTKIAAKKQNEENIQRIQMLNKLKEKQRIKSGNENQNNNNNNNDDNNPFADNSSNRRKRSSASQRKNTHDNNNDDDEDDELDIDDYSHSVDHDDLSSFDDFPHPGDVFLSLADIYFSDDYFQLFSTPEELAIPPGSTPPSSVYRSAVNLLNLYHHYMDPVKIVRIIPEYVPLPALQLLFSRLIPRTFHDRRHGQIIKMLAKTEHLNWQFSSIKQKSQYYYIDEEEKCAHCNKMIGETFVTAIKVEFGQIDYDKGIQPEIPVKDEEEPMSPVSPKLRKEKKGETRNLLLHVSCLNNYQLRHNRR